MKTKIIVILIALAILAVSMAGCTQPSTPPTNTNPVCGNGTIESGEQCDGTGCANGQTCNNQCKCIESIPGPPAPSDFNNDQKYNIPVPPAPAGFGE